MDKAHTDNNHRKGVLDGGTVIMSGIWLAFAAICAFLLNVEWMQGTVMFISALCISIGQIYFFGKKEVVAPEATDFTANLANERSIDWPERLFNQLAPIWSRQIETARSASDDAIGDLTEKFNNIVFRLEDTVKASVQARGGNGDSHCDGDIETIFKNSQQELNTIITSLNDSVDAKKTMLEQINALGEYIAEMNKMAEDVANIAKQTNLLALNAAIEAARAGEHGRGFSVVADEVRHLSLLSEEMSHKISGRLNDVTTAIEQAVDLVQNSVNEDRKSVSATEEHIQSVMEQLNVVTAGLSTSTTMLQENSVVIQEEISEILTSFQFQDRVSQILQQINRNICELNQEVENLLQCKTDNTTATDIDVDTWVSNVTKEYTMEEQFANHFGNEVSQPATSGVTFL